MINGKMEEEQNKKLFIQGITKTGKRFRPSDWAERLCCSVSCFKPEGYSDRGNKLNMCSIYSPYAVPKIIDGVPYVVIDERIGEINPMALSFLINFADDNDLPIIEACELPDAEN